MGGGQWCAGKCVTASSLLQKINKSMVCSICHFPWCKYPYHGPFQATNITEHGTGKRCVQQAIVRWPRSSTLSRGPWEGPAYWGPWVRTHWHIGLPRSRRHRRRSTPLPGTGHARTACCTALQDGAGGDCAQPQAWTPCCPSQARLRTRRDWPTIERSTLRDSGMEATGLPTAAPVGIFGLIV